MIIDCHGHYTTAPRSLEAWRARQAALARRVYPRLDGWLELHGVHPP